MYSTNLKMINQMYQSNHSFLSSLLFNIVLTIRAPWFGGFEYIPLTTKVT